MSSTPPFRLTSRTSSTRESLSCWRTRGTPPRPGYDQRTDQWTTTYGAGAGLILFAAVDARQRVIILRLV